MGFACRAGLDYTVDPQGGVSLSMRLEKLGQASIISRSNNASCAEDRDMICCTFA